MQGTNEEVSPDTSRCWLVWTIKSRSYGQSPGTREALGVSPGFCRVSLDHGKVDRSSTALSGRRTSQRWDKSLEV